MALIARYGIWYLRKKIGGKRRRISTGFPVGTKQSKESAKRRAAEIETEIRSGVHGWTKETPTVKTYWLKTYRPTYTEQKAAPQRDDQVMAHALPIFGDTPLHQVKKSDCERYLAVRRKSLRANPQHTHPKKISEGTVQRERSFLHAFFQQAVDDEIIDRNPWKKIERKPYSVRHRILTEANQGKLLRALSPRFQRFVQFLLGTGVRLDEARGIDHMKDLHLDERWIKVTGKFGKTREVPLPAELVPMLRSQLEADGTLWTQNPQRLREVLQTAAVKAKVPHLSPHDLRHTFGHRWLSGGGDIYTLSRILGHESVKVTETHYAYLLTEDLRAAADRVNLGLGLPRAAGTVVRMARGATGGHPKAGF